MIGNCRGSSSTFCVLYKFFTMKLTIKHMHDLYKHQDFPYIRVVIASAGLTSTYHVIVVCFSCSLLLPCTSPIAGKLDIAGVRTFVINSARVVFLNESPQPRHDKGDTNTYERRLLDTFCFC